MLCELEVDAAYERLGADLLPWARRGESPPQARGGHVVEHELKRWRYTQWNWALHLPLDAAAVEARLGLLQENV